MPPDRDRALRGALAGATAATIWAAQQPLDKRLFGSRYDDLEMLGKAVTRGPAWPAVGLAMHVVNGAAFGALYARFAPRMPLPVWSRGPATALAEHVALWPLAAVTDRLHPAREDMPRISRSRTAFLQGAWRHLLFGLTLGEIERRLNPPQDEEVPSFEHVVSQNGHGDIAHAAGIGSSA